LWSHHDPQRLLLSLHVLREHFRLFIITTLT
jgi:hypothetical protein